MKSYYNILKIQKDAEPLDIKKAYFSLVRKFPPDRYPDEFKQIREAYEVLIDEQTRREYDSYDDLPGIVKLYFDEGRKALAEGDVTKAIKHLEKVVASYPNFTIVNSLLGDAYLKNDNSGKAISIYKKLLSQEPRNASFLGKLARAYYDRGWLLKSEETYEKAVNLDEDNISYWEGLINCQAINANFETARRTALHAIEISEANDWDSLPIFIDLIHADIMTHNFEDLDKHFDKMKKTAFKYGGDKDNAAWFLQNVAELLQRCGLTEHAAAAISTAHEILPNEAKIKETYNDITRDKRLRQMIDRLASDASFPEIYSGMFGFELEKCDDSDCVNCRFEEFAYEMDIVEDLVRHRKHLKRLKELYPELYKLKQAFFDMVLDVVQTKKLSWEYEKKMNKFYKLCPEKFAPNDDTDEKNGYFPQEPVRREGEKIGRNDPCPCGSGKKYKKCCGR